MKLIALRENYKMKVKFINKNDSCKIRKQMVEYSDFN